MSNIFPLPRGLGPQVERWWARAPVVIIEGGRAIGKTTLCESLAPSLQIVERVDLGLGDRRREAAADPDGFVESLRVPALIDEAQLVDDLTIAIKRRVDRAGGPGQFLLTGSARLGRGALGGSDPLAGRAVRLTLRPFTVSERHGRPANRIAEWFSPTIERRSVQPVSRETARRLALEGGMPTMPGVLGPGSDLERAAFLNDYFEAVLHLTVAPGIDRTRLLRTFRYLAANPGQIFVAARAASELEMTTETVRNYLEVLERSFLLWRADAHRPAEHRTVTAHPRLYPADTAAAAWALRLLGVTTSGDGTAPDPAHGGLLETLVATECIAQASWGEGHIEVRHWRDTKAKVETDLLLIDPSGRMVGVEVKNATSVRPDDLKGLRRLADRHGHQYVRGIVIYTGDRTFPVEPDIWAVPLSCLLDLDHPLPSGKTEAQS